MPCKKTEQVFDRYPNTCLKCGRGFRALSRWNKICPGCTAQNEDLSGLEVKQAAVSAMTHHRRGRIELGDV